YSCTYTVSGNVDLDLPVVPVRGAEVIIDAFGLAPCTAIVSNHGTYSCALAPDVVEIGDGSAVAFPLDYSVTVVRPGGSTEIAHGNGQFATRAAFGGYRS